MNEINIYDEFRKLKSLMEMRQTERGFVKIVQTGQCSLGDYGNGFLAINIYTIPSNDPDKYHCMIIYKTTDDGDFGGWSEKMPKSDAIATMNKVADYYRDIVALPSDDEVNDNLRPLGMYTCHL